MKRPQSSVFQFRRRIPRDVLDKARGQTLTVPVGGRTVHRVVGPKATELTFSLGTRDPGEAKSREAQAISYLDRMWEALRSGTTSLTKRDAVALAGELYRDWIEIVGDDPGPKELWERINSANEAALAGEYGLGFFMLTEKAKRQTSLEERFGGFVNSVLARHSLSIDKASRDLLLDEVARAMVQVSEQLERHANSDFRPDPDADRFPQMPEHKGNAGEGSCNKASFKRLIEGRWREAEAGGASKRTLSAWNTSFKHLSEFLGHDDGAKVTRASVVAFKDQRIAQGVSLKTVKDSDLAALKSVFGWAVANGYLASNPAEGVTVKLGRNAHTDKGRPKGFTDAEAEFILRYAIDYHPSSGSESVRTTAAKRWIPWLLAFSGARVGEIAQLRKEDVYEQADRWIIRITPAAGAVKTGRTRLVPLHRQLVDLGFLEFVRTAPDGHLFVKPSDPSDPSGAVSGLVNRVRAGLAGVVPGDGVQPFHAWRHRFTTKARELGCDDSMIRAIVGHSAKDVYERYGDNTIVAMAWVVDAFPDVPLR